MKAKGFSLLELIIALSILSIVVLGGIYSTFFSTFSLRRISEETALAFYELESALEDIRATPFKEIPLKYPHNENIAYYSDSQKRKLPLNLQTVKIEYHQGNTTANPLEIRLTISWKSFSQKDLQNLQLWTKITK